MTESMEPFHNVQRAIDRLRSFHSGDLGVIDVIACSKAAIPALRALLSESDPSGLFEARCRAVEALAAIGATDVLIEFLGKSHDFADPVQQLGEDAVVNAAARAIANVREDFVFDLLLSLAHHRRLPGVLTALAAFDRSDTIPIFVEALAEDECRMAAEAALRRFGAVARPALLQSAILPVSSTDSVGDSSVRRRRSALALLVQIDCLSSDWHPADWTLLRNLMHDSDHRVAVNACKIWLRFALPTDRGEAVGRLRNLLSRADWLLADEIKKCLSQVNARDSGNVHR